MEFKCTSCGLCCKRIGQILSQPPTFAWMEPPIRDFPYKAREDGSCEKLKNNLCSVYEDRPLLCNIDRMADETDIPVSKETWFDLNYKGCEILQMEIRQ